MQQRDVERVSRGTVAAFAGLILISGIGLAQSNSTAPVPDAQIEANVLKSLAGAPQLASENIISNTVYGTVTLSGTVKDEPIRQMAETMASRVSGVKKVIDELTLGTSNTASSPSAGDYANAALDAQGSNPLLQSDGTMAPAQPNAQQSQRAPDPDTYAAQHGMDEATGQSQPPDDSMDTGQPSQPSYRQPYNAPNGNGSQQAGAGSTVNPQPPSAQQPYPQQQPNNGQPYSRGEYKGQQHNSQPPPYGAQRAGQPVVVPSGSLIRVRINEGLDSKHAQPGTPFQAIVLNDVVADGAVAIPRGADVQGTVVDAKSGGVLKGHGELALQLTQVTLAGRTYPLTSDIWSRDSSDKGSQTVGSAVGLGAVGALIGAVAGGGPGALVGAGVGGAAGVGASASSGGRQVLVPSEAILAFHLAQPAPLTTISQAEMDRLSYGVPAGAQPQMRRRYPPPPPPYYGPVYYPRPYPYSY